MNKEDLKIVKKLKKAIIKYPNFRFFLANKVGGNASGIGADRSVILSKYDGHWSQFSKVWGENNVERAKNIIKLAKE